ncbi:hypothetical protein BC941DRAFT_443497 [Chlamydoabsidia padenii]|nr:hypothetical protein BC941DRAFT_443497 [Chlamydoabsidia padenii]
MQSKNQNTASGLLILYCLFYLMIPNTVCFFHARPDFINTNMDGLFFGSSLGFAEMKPATNTSKYLMSKDLIRLGVLSKNSLDQHDLQGCLTIQAVGFQMTVFLITLHADGFYLMFEIGT